MQFRYNVVLLTLTAAGVVLPAAAVQTRRFRNVSIAAENGAKEMNQMQGCEGKPDLEFYLDSMSWKLYEGMQWGTDAGNLSLKEVRAPSTAQKKDAKGDAYQNQAAARVMRFVRAVDSYNVNNTAPVAIVGNNNHSKSLSKRNMEQSSEQAYCCHHVPGSDPYWQETENYDETHHGYIKCQYSDGCTRPVTNSMRVKSIRRALKGSRSLFQTLNVQSLLYGGSAIGQQRCGDVIPWDIDCDFMLPEHAIGLIHEKAFGKKMDFDKWETGETSVDLAHLGAPGIRLIKKTPCTPFEIVDTQDGFFCDVFTSKLYSGALYTPWWSGTSPCPGLFKGCDKIGGGQRCYKFNENTIAPQACVMSGVTQTCPSDMPTFLQATYGNAWSTANNSIPIAR